MAPSSAIGEFVIGESPIEGTLLAFDPTPTIISQYANSPTLLRLIEDICANVDPTENFEDFYNLIWNIDTAVGYGLDVWGRIVGVSRVLCFQDQPVYFGFNDGLSGAAADYAPFNQAPFNAGVAITANYALSDDAYRTLILVKAAANIAATNSPTLNKLLTQLFTGRGRCYVNDLGFMKMRFTFEFYLQPFEFAIMTSSGAIPRPSGVGVSILQAPQGATFGFQEAGDAQPFGQGTLLGSAAYFIAA